MHAYAQHIPHMVVIKRIKKTLTSNPFLGIYLNYHNHNIANTSNFKKILVPENHKYGNLNNNLHQINFHTNLNFLTDLLESFCHKGHKITDTF